MRVLVTGGAGYIGSVAAMQLLEDGYDVTVLDDLSTGHRDALPPRARFVEGRVQQLERLHEALEGCDAVMHFASLSLVGESVREPRRYFQENVGAALSLLQGMERRAVGRLVFSSSAAVYGSPDVDVIDELQPIVPINPYGQTKSMIEQILRDENRATGIGVVSLRYFNACGAAFGRGEDHSPETHLIPRLCAHLLGRLDDFEIHGADYPTPDGTAIRDYIHVADLATAHALALPLTEAGAFDAINLGTGSGNSVLEMVESAVAVSGKPMAPVTGARREGDPPRLVASNEKAARILKWRPSRSEPRQILEDAWAWHSAHPAGYAD